jgi:hypothetical protein
LRAGIQEGGWYLAWQRSRPQPCPKAFFSFLPQNENEKSQQEKGKKRLESQSFLCGLMEDTAPLWSPMLGVEDALVVRATSRTIAAAVEVAASQWRSLCIKVGCLWQWA